MRVAQRVLPATRTDDRVAVRETSDGLVVAVADGAGGSSGAGRAAELASAAAIAIDPTSDVLAALRAIDVLVEQDAEAGETTLVVVWIRHGLLEGASVGDSGAILVTEDDVRDLTSGQRRTPRLGTGFARPVSFGPIAMQGRLVVATDGLVRYASLSTIAAATRDCDLEQAADRLIDAVRLPSGAFQDHVAVVVVEGEEGDEG